MRGGQTRNCVSLNCAQTQFYCSVPCGKTPLFQALPFPPAQHRSISSLFLSYEQTPRTFTPAEAERPLHCASSKPEQHIQFSPLQQSNGSAQTAATAGIQPPQLPFSPQIFRLLLHKPSQSRFAKPKTSST